MRVQPLCGGIQAESRPKSQTKKTGRALRPAPEGLLHLTLRWQHSHDLERAWIHNDDFVADQEEFIPSPFRIDRNNFGRERMEVYLSRHAGADRDREVDM